jgi:hypothetical protein
MGRFIYLFIYQFKGLFLSSSTFHFKGKTCWKVSFDVAQGWSEPSTPLVHHGMLSGHKTFFH